jgi:hypothetical protein
MQVFILILDRTVYEIADHMFFASFLQRLTLVHFTVNINLWETMYMHSPYGYTLWCTYHLQSSSTKTGLPYIHFYSSSTKGSYQFFEVA